MAVAGECRGRAERRPRADVGERRADSGQPRGGWYPWDPDQYRDYRRGVPILTGFDVEIERALARVMSVEILLPEIAWQTARGARCRDGGHRRRRDGERFAQPFRVFFKAISNGDKRSHPAEGCQRPVPFRTVDAMPIPSPSRSFASGSSPGFVYAGRSRQRLRSPMRHIGTRSFRCPTMRRTCEISWPASSTASSPIASPQPPPPGGGGRRAHRRASAALLRPNSFHVEPRDADAADVGSPQRRYR